MKKNLLLFTAVAAFGYVSLTSYQSGPASAGSQHRTGAKLSPTTCGASGCHGTAAGPTVTITVKSGATVVTNYVPGASYTVEVRGSGTTNSKFGFQFAAVSGTGAAQVSTGSFGTMPSGVHTSTAVTSLTLVEQSVALNATSPGLFETSFPWTAPSTGVGNITMYCTINSVNGGVSGADAGDLSGNTSVVLPQSTVSVATVSNSTGVTAYPNPTVNTLNFQTENNGTYTVRAYDLNGRNVANEQVTVNGSTASISTANWAPGFYQVVLEKDGNMQVIRAVKN